MVMLEELVCYPLVASIKGVELQVFIAHYTMPNVSWKIPEFEIFFKKSNLGIQSDNFATATRNINQIIETDI